MLAEGQRLGAEALAELESDRHRFGIILFGRPYNAFVKEAHLGIPHKLSTKDVLVIPHDFLPIQHLPSYENMYWASGQQIIRAARFVKDHPKLFGVFITNFSCGPDSFIVSYFRTLMGSKPSLTLELDSHSADVGVNTRIEAALDIMTNYLELSKRGLIANGSPSRIALQVMETTNGIQVRDASGKSWDLRSRDVQVVMPSLGRFSTRAMAASLRSEGIRTKTLEVPTTQTLKYGRSHTNCKECLPFILTTGQMVEHLSTDAEAGLTKSLFFMPHGCGPCRQGQYAVRMKDVINERGFRNAGILSLREDNGYGGLGSRFFRRAWTGLVLSDLVADAENALKVLASHPPSALELLQREWEVLEDALVHDRLTEVFPKVDACAQTLSRIPLRMRPEDAKVISLIGEFYVRREEFSSQELVDALMANGFVVRVTPLAEFIYYVNYLATAVPSQRLPGLMNRLSVRGKDAFQRWVERRLRKPFAKTGLVSGEMINVERTIAMARRLISEEMIGEAVLTVGVALRDVLDESAGIVSIGPFGCMPSRVAEAMLVKEMTFEGKRKSQGMIDRPPAGVTTLPYLHVETDGSPFPQITQSKLEIFMLQANKLHEKMMIAREGRVHAA